MILMEFQSDPAERSQRQEGKSYEASFKVRYARIVWELSNDPETLQIIVGFVYILRIGVCVCPNYNRITINLNRTGIGVGQRM